MLRVIIVFHLFLLPLASAQIDLHAHLHMKPGLGFFLRGSFEEEPHATRWGEKIGTKVTGTSLARLSPEERPRLIVLSLYAHPYLSYSFRRDGLHFNRRENVRKAIEQEYVEFSEFVGKNSGRFAIAKNAKEARSILKSGKKTAIVLSLEGAWAVLESDEDFRLWVEERGLAIVTPVHLTPDSLGGNAMMTALIGFVNSTADFLEAVWTTRGECLREFCKSARGFTQKGSQLIDELIKRGVWIDLAHANEKEVVDVLGRYEPRKLPLLVTHTQLREFYPVERGLGKEELNYIRRQDGIIGLIPSQYMMSEAMDHAYQEVLQSHPEEAEAASAAKGLSCISSLDVFKKTVAYAIAVAGRPERVGLASDVNAPLDGLSPACGEAPALKDGDASFDLHRRGYYTYSQWNALTRFVAADPAWPDHAMEHFLKMWERVRH